MCYSQLVHSVLKIVSVISLSKVKQDYLPSVTLRPQVKVLRLDFGVKLWQTTHESLQDFPSGLCGEIGSIFML